MNKRLLAAGIFLIFVGLFWIFSTPEPRTAGPNVPASIQDESGFLDHPAFGGSILLIIGIALTVHNSRQVRHERSTARQGTETYGIITDVINTGRIVNHSAQFKANVQIMGKSGTVFELTKVYYGSDTLFQYTPGDFVRIMYLDDNVNILYLVDRNSLPSEIADRLEEEYRNTARY